MGSTGSRIKTGLATTVAFLDRGAARDAVGVERCNDHPPHAVAVINVCSEPKKKFS